MPQIFHRSANIFSRLSIFGGLFILAGVVAFAGLVARSPIETAEGVPVDQPIPFSHRLHVGEMQIDCRYCHTTVEESAFAGMPTSATCYNCHRFVRAQSPLLEPLRNSIQYEVPIVWTRVYDLPDFAYFDHSIHVAKGFGCETCHGRVDRMTGMWKAESLLMSWCLECHRDPAQFIRPREAVFTMGWEPPVRQEELGPLLVEEYGVDILLSCTICHR